MTHLMRALDWILDRVTLVLLAVLLLVVGGQVFSRYVLNHSLFWSEELARYLFIYLVFLGAAIVLRRNGHIQVSFFVERLPPGVRRAIAVLVDLLLLWFTATILVQSIRLASMVWTVLTAAMEIPWTLVYLGIVVGMAAMVLAMFGALWRHVTGRYEGDRT
jgi:TRAP-type C4-dicarboxylate transport system permease small subunit